MHTTTEEPIDREAIARLLEKRGERVSVSLRPYLTEATIDAIRRWADATGDLNPLFHDPEYARRWGHEDVIAPPVMLYAFDRLSIGYRGGLPGVHSFFGGTNWHWRGHVARNDAISAAVVFRDLIEHESTFADVSLRQVSDIVYENQDGVCVATAEAWGMRTGRRRAREVGSLKRSEPSRYSPAQIERIAEEYGAEAPLTGPRSGADVEVGEQLPTIIRGPYTLTNVIAFEQAWGGLFIRSHSDWFDFLRRHPAAKLYNELGIPEPPEAVHWDRELARVAGVPEAYDYGPERIAWLAVLVTNWIGPTGFLRRLNVQVRRFNLVGDLTRCHGTVTGTRQVDDGWLVELSVWAENQRGERTAFGTAEVRL